MRSLASSQVDIHPTAAIRLPASEQVDDWAYVEEPEIPLDLEFFSLRQIVTWAPRLTPAQERQKRDEKVRQVLREADRVRREALKAERAAEREREKPARIERERVRRWFGRMKPPAPCGLCGFPLPYEKAVCIACLRERDRVYRETVTVGWCWVELPDGSNLKLAPSQLEQFRLEALQHRMDVEVWAMHRLGLTGT